MTHETYCADKLRLFEEEQFIAIGDESVARILNPTYEEDLRNGRAERLPDLLSTKREGSETFFRLREVKFKLEDRLVRKALTQLVSGIKDFADPWEPHSSIVSRSSWLCKAVP